MSAQNLITLWKLTNFFHFGGANISVKMWHKAQVAFLYSQQQLVNSGNNFPFLKTSSILNCQQDAWDRQLLKYFLLGAPGLILPSGLWGVGFVAGRGLDVEGVERLLILGIPGGLVGLTDWKQFIWAFSFSPKGLKVNAHRWSHATESTLKSVTIAARW